MATTDLSHSDFFKLKKYIKSELFCFYWSLEQQQPKLLQSLMRHRKIYNLFLWIWEYNLALCIDSSDSNWYAHRLKSLCNKFEHVIVLKVS